MSQTKKYRDFNREFKVRAVQRMLAGESPSVLARELKVLRKQIYQWKDAYISKGPTALHMRGRPSKNQVP